MVRSATAPEARHRPTATPPAPQADDPTPSVLLLIRRRALVWMVFNLKDIDTKILNYF
jgi:hypothetical protein